VAFHHRHSTSTAIHFHLGQLFKRLTLSSKLQDCVWHSHLPGSFLEQLISHPELAPSFSKRIMEQLVTFTIVVEE